MAIVFILIFSAAIAFFIFAFSQSIMNFLGAEANSYLEDYGSKYLSVYSFGIVFLFCGWIMHSLMNIDKDNSRAFYVIIATTLVNIVGDFYVVLFTNFGIFGIALTTLLSNFVYFAVLALHFLRKKRILHFKFTSIKNFLPIFLNICKQGSLSTFTSLSKSFADILINHIIILYSLPGCSVLKIISAKNISK